MGADTHGSVQEVSFKAMGSTHDAPGVLRAQKEQWEESHTHLSKPRMKAWKRLRLLLSGARRLTWLYRVPREQVLAPEHRGGGGAVSQDLPHQPPPHPPRSLRAHLASPKPLPRSRGCCGAAR